MVYTACYTCPTNYKNEIKIVLYKYASNYSLYYQPGLPRHLNATIHDKKPSQPTTTTPDTRSYISFLTAVAKIKKRRKILFRLRKSFKPYQRARISPVSRTAPILATRYKRRQKRNATRESQYAGDHLSLAPKAAKQAGPFPLSALPSK